MWDETRSDAKPEGKTLGKKEGKVFEEEELRFRNALRLTFAQLGGCFEGGAEGSSQKGGCVLLANLRFCC